MKFFTIALALLFTAPAAFANGPGESSTTTTTATNPHQFNNPGEVAIEVERGKQEVVLHILLKDMSQYDHVLIERSADNVNNFSQCKYINPATDKADATDYFKKLDRYPLPVKADCYYRIVTVSKDGITKIYPGVLLPALQL
jgi:hypothetical protein